MMFNIGDTVINREWCYKGFISNIIIPNGRHMNVYVLGSNTIIAGYPTEGTKLTRLVLIEKTRGI